MTCYLFPGQGSQIKGMGENLFDRFPKMTEKADHILGYSIKELCLNNQGGRLHKTQYTQPALYVVNALSYLQQRQTGPAPHCVAGHSLGEYNALQASGALSFDDGLKLVKKRGELMSQAPQGGMAAIIGLTLAEVKQQLAANNLDTIDIANVNAPTQIVISGSKDHIMGCFKVFEKTGANFIPLNVSGAFHSRYMADARAQFITYLDNFTFNDFEFPVIANVTARPYEKSTIQQLLADQITHSVLWVDSVQYMLNQGHAQFKELGVGQVLTTLVDKISSHQATPAPTHAIPSPEKLKKRINDWNQTYPIGTPVNANGYQESMQTRTPATVLFGHRAAIYLQGKKGYFALDEISPLNEAN